MGNDQGDGSTSTWFAGNDLAPSLNDQHAEHMLLATLMADPRSIDALPLEFRADHYATEAHRDIHHAIMAISVDLRQHGEPVAILVANALGADQDLRAYILDLFTTSVMPPSMVAPLATSISDLARRRELMGVLTQLRADIATPHYERPALGLVAAAMGEFDRIAGNGTGAQPVSTLAQSMDAALDAADAALRNNGTSGFSTGFPSIDAVTGGLEASTLTVLAGRPGSGKSALGLQIGLAAARAGIGVLAFSLEMSAMALGRRALAAASGVPIRLLRSGRHGPHMDRLLDARREMLDLPFSIEDGGGMSADAISLRVRVANRRRRVGLILVDHLHIVRVEAADMRAGPTWATGAVSHAMQRLAKQHDCSVLLLAQLNRALEARDDKRPSLADLRQSGDIEQDADVVGFVYRPEMYLKAPDLRGEKETVEKYAERVEAYDSARLRLGGVAEVLFEKVRDGERKNILLRFDGPTTSFSEC